MPKLFVIGVVVYILLLIAGVTSIAYLLTSPRKKTRSTQHFRHLRRRGYEGVDIRRLVKRYRNGGPRSYPNHRG